jgi:adenosine 3'-phospho 5'-phosphosulfate transporter B3
MISAALLFDAIIGNVQEKEMKIHGASNAEIVLYSYSIGIAYILAYLFLSGDFLPAFKVCVHVSKLKYFLQNPFVIRRC